MPPLTKDVGGPYDRASDPSVAYDALAKLWLILSVATLGLGPTSNGNPVFATDGVLSITANGGTVWNDPVLVAYSLTDTQPYDKPWMVCDTTPTSAYYGRCYASWGAYKGMRRRVPYGTSPSWCPGSCPASSHPFCSTCWPSRRALVVGAG